MEFSVEAIKPIEGISPTAPSNQWAFAAARDAYTKQKTDVLDVGKQVITNDQAMRILFERVLSQVNSLFSSGNQEYTFPEDALLDDTPSVVGSLMAEWSLRAFDNLVPNQDSILSVLPGAIQTGASDATTIFEELNALTPALQQDIDTALQAALDRVNELIAAHVSPSVKE